MNIALPSAVGFLVALTACNAAPSTAGNRHPVLHLNNGITMILLPGDDITHVSDREKHREEKEHHTPAQAWVFEGDEPLFHLDNAENEYTHFYRNIWHDIHSSRPIPRQGTPLDGDDAENFWFLAYPGGAHNPSDLFLFRTSNKGTTWECIPSVYGNPFVRQGDAWRIQTVETHFGYWRCCYANSAAPYVLLGWNGTAHVPDWPATAVFLALDEPTLQARSARVQKRLRTNDASDENHELVQTLLDLTYAGRMARAKEFFDASWPADVCYDKTTREEYWREFMANLAYSEHWADLRRINGLTAPDATPASK